MTPLLCWPQPSDDPTPQMTPPLWWLHPSDDPTLQMTPPLWWCVSHPSWLRSVVETEYPNEDASSSPHRMNSGTRRYALSFFSSTTAPVWLARGAPATNVSSECCITPFAESTEKPENGLASHRQLSHSHANQGKDCLYNTCIMIIWSGTGLKKSVLQSELHGLCSIT